MIAFLLFLILCALLFGAGAVLSGLGWLAFISAGLLVILVAVLGSAAFIRGVHDGIASERRQQRPWLYLIIGLPAMIGLFGIAFVEWVQGGKIGEPYSWVPLALLIASMSVLALESANSWLPKVPAFVTGFCAGWAKFLVAPVLAPIGHWRSIRTPNPDGDRTGVVVASVSTLWTFIVAVFLWWFAVLPLILVASITYHAVR